MKHKNRHGKRLVRGYLAFNLGGMARETVTLTIAGYPVTFTVRDHRVSACRPPHVPVAQPGPCPGTKVPKAARKPRAKYAITGPPELLGPREFERRFPVRRRLYRGVANADRAADSRAGKLGGGDYGAGVYADTRIGVAQGYAGRGDGVVMRLGIKPGAKVRRLPEQVWLRGSAAIDRWAAENNVDVVDVGGTYQIIKNPAVIVADRHDYTVRQSVVLDTLQRGFQMPDGYQAEVEQLRNILGIDIPDAGMTLEQWRSSRQRR